MDLKDNLIKYTQYSQGDLSKKCSLKYDDIEIIEFDFSKYDLNNSYFGGVDFHRCDFSNVYLSGSNFGGSYLKECLLRENINKKSTWDDMTFEKSNILAMNAFRTTFTYGKFRDTNFSKCYFERCLFSNSDMENVCFRECTIVDSDFTNCKFDNVQFIKCKFENVQFDENVDNNITIIDNI